LDDPNPDTEALRELLIDLEQSRDHEAAARRDSEMLLQGLRSLANADTSDDMFGELFAVLRQHLGCDDLFVLRSGEDGGIEVPHATDARFVNGGWSRGAMFDRVLGGDVVAAFDVSRIPEWRDQCDEARASVVSALHGPLKPAGRPGMLVATSHRRGYFADPQVAVMRRMLLLVEQALLNVEVRETRKREAALLIHREQLQQMVEERTSDLLQAKQAADRANKSKGRLVASLSHELRSPLHAVIAFTDLARRRGELSFEEARRYFDRIHLSGQTILKLVDELLDLAKLESGRLSFAFDTADAAQLVYDVVDEFESMMQYKQLVLKMQLEAASVRLDATRIKQVLRNLLSNAIKFSPPGSELVIGLTVHGGALRFEVVDQGEGIADEAKERVFDSYVQTASGAAITGGTGLGLAICREIIAAHDGRIWVEDTQAGGSRFVFTLPGAVAASTVAGA
jgi:signal transduction histidine kinase